MCAYTKRPRAPASLLWQQQPVRKGVLVCVCARDLRGGRIPLTGPFEKRATCQRAAATLSP